MRLNQVTLKSLDTGSRQYDSPNDAKNILAAFNKQSVARGKKDTSKIGDKKIEKLISKAGISNFDSEQDANKFTNFLIDRAKEKRTERRATNQLIKEAKKAEPQEGEKPIMKEIRRAIKQETGEKPSKLEVKRIIRRANKGEENRLGNELDKKDIKKIRRAAGKAKKRKNKKK
jgi:uncharacterized protein YneF (UPF0154 family)